jgi:hypothetical protein
MSDFTQFEFGDSAWAEVNRHAGLPDDAREQIANAISWYQRFCPHHNELSRSSDIKSDLTKLVKKADALLNELGRLSNPALMTLIQFREPELNAQRGFHIPRVNAHTRLLGHITQIGALRDWCKNAKEQLGKDRPGAHPAERKILIRASATIYEAHAKQPFNDFDRRNDFIYAILRIAGAGKESRRAIDDDIRACFKDPLEKLPTAEELEDIWHTSFKISTQKR